MNGKRQLMTQPETMSKYNIQLTFLELLSIRNALPGFVRRAMNNSLAHKMKEEREIMIQGEGNQPLPPRDAP